MKLFLSYRYTGQSSEILQEIIPELCSKLSSFGYTLFCSLDHNQVFVSQNFNYKQILQYCLEELDKSEGVVVFINSAEKSEGMLLEVGYAIAKKKKIILLIQKDIKTLFLREIADHVFEFSDVKNVCDEIKNLPQIL